MNKIQIFEQIEAPQVRIRVFQIDHEKNSNDLAFMYYDYVQSHGGLDSSIYRQVYGGTVNCDNLESVFVLCNSDNVPPGYLGEPTFVSSIKFNVFIN